MADDPSRASNSGVESPAGGQLVDIVDEHDHVLTCVTRSEMRRSRLRHRAVFVVVMNDAGDVLVHRRSLDKDIWPGWLDIAVGGVLASGESYHDGAVRELSEEIGIEGPVLEPFDDGKAQLYDDSDVSLIGRCFRLRHSGPFVFRDGEIDEAWWVPLSDLPRLIATEQVLPDSRALLLDRLVHELD